MENKIEIFKNEELREARSLIIEGEHWFVGKDVAKAPRRIDGKGYSTQAIIINESGKDFSDLSNIKELKFS